MVCFFGAAGFRFFFVFFFERTRPAASMRPPCLIYLSTSTDCESCCRPISTNPGSSYGSGRVWANAWDVIRRTPSRSGRGRRAAVDFVCVLGAAGFRLFFLAFFFERTRPAASMRSPCLIYLSTSADCESCTRPISTNPGSSYGNGRVWANIAWDVFRRTPSRAGRGRLAAVDFVVCFGCGGISFFFSSNAHHLLQV